MYRLHDYKSHIIVENTWPSLADGSKAGKIRAGER